MHLTFLFSKVVLEVDSIEVSRWSADWITDATGVVNKPGGSEEGKKTRQRHRHSLIEGADRQTDRQADR